jgi:hypothetical protein
MKTLLEIRSSIYSERGASNRLADRFAAPWRAADPGGKVIVRDLASAPVPHIEGERFGAFIAKPEQRTRAQQVVVGYSDALIVEPMSAEGLALGAASRETSPDGAHARIDSRLAQGAGGVIAANAPPQVGCGAVTPAERAATAASPA